MRRTAAFSLALVLVVALLPAGAGARQGNAGSPPAEVNKDLPPGLLSYHEIGPRLRAIETASNRVRVEVVGQSVQGRDLYLVTVSDPNSFGRLGRYQALRKLMLRDPEEAQRRAEEFEDFKVPIFVNASIHGNEWEGVDASVGLIERLAFADDPATRKILENAIVLFNVVQNPDGRVLGQRQNANGFDLNRDFVTLSQPETRITKDILVHWNPMVTLDLHGYVNPYLIEPTTPPHNPNYEYDLYIKWAFDQAKAMEANLKRETGLDAVIPYRDWEVGDWDDWPPIFTPMYAMYHGSYGSTLESPMRVNGSAVNLPPEERRQRAETNLRAHMATVWGALTFAAENRRGMVHDQIEIFRRGRAGEPQVPIPFGGEYGPEDEYIASFPQAYVIPAGGQQRSETAAVRLVNYLTENDVEVMRANRPFSVGGTSYPAGSYVVDMDQAKRGFANTVLEHGWDISDISPQMYDISGWSHGLLWGATVDRVDKDVPFSVSGTLVQSKQQAAGQVESGKAIVYSLRVEDVNAVRAVNHLLDLGVELLRLRDGRVLIPASAKSELNKLAATEGVRFAALARRPDGGEALGTPRIAAAIASDEYFVLTQELGFDVTRVSTAQLNSGFDVSNYDVLMVSSGLSYDSLTAPARARVDAFFASGGGLVTRGITGARFNQAARLLPVSYERGRSDANGVARVVRPDASDVFGVYSRGGHTFVYSPLWWTGLGQGVSVEERFLDGDFFVAGHWIGQENASGRASVVSGRAGTGTRAVLFGTEPLFRAHPKGLYAQVAHALYWASN